MKEFTKEDLEKAFKAGGWILTWSDDGFEPKYDKFEDWFNEFIKNK